MISSVIQAAMIAIALGVLSGYSMSVVGLAFVGTLLIVVALAGAVVGGVSLLGAIATVGFLVLCYNVGLTIGLVPRLRTATA